MKKILSVLVVIMIVIIAVSCGGNSIIVFETNHGNFEVTLWADKAPIASKNMVDKANSGFYDNLTFHRIVDGFVVQGGDPHGTGTGGENMKVDTTFADSTNIRGTIAMASSTISKNGRPMAHQSDAQFFINLDDNSNLDELGFVVFGEVTSGMDIVDAIAKVEVEVGRMGEKSTPTTPVDIVKAYVK